MVYIHYSAVVLPYFVLAIYFLGGAIDGNAILWEQCLLCNDRENWGDCPALTVRAALSGKTSLCRNLPLSLANEKTYKNQSKKAYYQRQESKNRPLLAIYNTDEPCYQRTYTRGRKGNKKDPKLN
jgi:hypothetical protein